MHGVDGVLDQHCSFRLRMTEDYFTPVESFIDILYTLQQQFDQGNFVPYRRCEYLQILNHLFLQLVGAPVQKSSGTQDFVSHDIYVHILPIQTCQAIGT